MSIEQKLSVTGVGTYYGILDTLMVYLPDTGGGGAALDGVVVLYKVRL